MVVETRRSQLTIRVWPVWVPAESRANRMLRNGSSLRSYNDFSGRNGSGHCGDATMPRDYPGGLIETMNGGVRARSCAAQPPSDRKTPCLENPRPKGGILTNGERRFSISG